MDNADSADCVIPPGEERAAHPPCRLGFRLKGVGKTITAAWVEAHLSRRPGGPAAAGVVSRCFIDSGQVAFLRVFNVAHQLICWGRLKPSQEEFLELQQSDRLVTR
ncbi:hypothetical protein [Streptomyces sp. NPDC007905]|uniref:hypothetical protein n=1 Tax=Streptomyces sp. NPDC007905 TaxID=3364788 RepID=UPI0036E30FD7